MATIFISTEDTTDPMVVTLVAALAGHTVDHSPLNPSHGDDPRWRDWYAQGCAAAIAAADVFVAAVTHGYDSSSWMAQELHVATAHHRDHGRPALFIAKPTARPLPAGFAPYEAIATVLVGSPDEIASALLARRLAATGD